MGLKQIAVFHQNDCYGQAGLDGVVRALKPLNLEPVALGTVERNTVDVAAAVKAIVPRQPDAIVQISAYKSLRRLHPRGAQGRLRRHLLQRLVRRHPGAGRRARPRRARRRRQPGHAVPVSPTTPVPREYLAPAQGRRRQVEPNYSSIEGYRRRQDLPEGLKRAGRSADARER